MSGVSWSSSMASTCTTQGIYLSAMGPRGIPDLGNLGSAGVDKTHTGSEIRNGREEGSGDCKYPHLE